MNIVVLDGYTTNPGDLDWQGFEALGKLTVYERTAPDQVKDRIRGAQAVITNKTPITASDMESSEELRYIGVLATGYNIVDTRAARERGIPVCNIPTYGTQAVAQFVFALLLEICHHVGNHSAGVHQGRWANSADFCYWDSPLIELDGLTMGIIGYGRIGRATAKIARAFGMKVIAYDAFAKDEDSVSLEEIWENSDVISLHCPLTAENAGLINRDTISKMKDGVILINTSRGPLVEEAALREGLLSGKVYMAAVDVVSTEPISPDNPLLGLDRCIITPHIAWANQSARKRLMKIATDNLASFQKGETKNNVW